MGAADLLAKEIMKNKRIKELAAGVVRRTHELYQKGMNVEAAQAQARKEAQAMIELLNSGDAPMGGKLFRDLE